MLQEILLSVYRTSAVRRMTQTRAGSKAFVVLYDLYKDHFEAAGNRALSRRIPENSWVVDVGANIGFFTERFALWVKGSGRVIAIEPAAKNVELLRRRIADRRLRVVDVHQAAATDMKGVVFLRMNPEHPGDHRISDHGEQVAAVRVDDLVADAGNPTVGLVKIDTQGNELRALMGAEQTIERCHPNLFIEVDDAALKENGSSAAEMVRFLTNCGYQFRSVSTSGVERSIPRSQVLPEVAAAKRGYIDLLCVHPLGPASQPPLACLPKIYPPSHVPS